MKKNNPSTRSLETVLISFFPDIDQEKLKELLKDDNISSPSKKRKSIADDVFFESASKFQKFSLNTLSNDNDNENAALDKMFAKKESNYIKTVKAVTTVNLPNPLAKKYELPTFLKQNILKVYKITGKAGHYTANRLRLTALKAADIIFTLLVTGSDDTDFAFKLLTKNFSNLSEKHKTVFIYISPSHELDSTLNFKNKKETIINKYAVDMRNLDTDRFFFSAEPSKPSEYPSVLTQYYKNSKNLMASFAFFGFNGLKGPKGCKKELEKNTQFLLKYHKEPYTVMKYDVYEKNDNTRSYNWLFVFDRINTNCFTCFKSFSKLVDFDKDKISGLTLLPKYLTDDDIKSKFFDEMKDRNFKNFDYACDPYESNASVPVKTKVNYGDDHYDFVVIYNSYNNSVINKLNYEKQKLSNYEILNDCHSNICVNNGM